MGDDSLEMVASSLLNQSRCLLPVAMHMPMIWVIACVLSSKNPWSSIIEKSNFLSAPPYD
jgi:hypothetical protein